MCLEILPTFAGHFRLALLERNIDYQINLSDTNSQF